MLLRWQPASWRSKNIAKGVGGLGFESRAGCIGHSIAKKSPPDCEPEKELKHVVYSDVR